MSCDVATPPHFKVLVIGESGVGKSSLVQQLTESTFDEHNFITTIGVDFRTYSLGETKLGIWDTAGQERFRSITLNCYRGAAGILLLFDLTDPSTFRAIPEWYREVRDCAPTAQLLLAGTKADAATCRRVTFEEGQAMAVELGIPLYMEVSAKTGQHVHDAFSWLAHHMRDTRSTEETVATTELPAEAPTRSFYADWCAIL